MAEPFIGEIRAFSFGFVPQGWALCDGSILNIASNQALYSLLGDTYGGNGRTTFALPNLQGRVPAQQGNQIAHGESAGEEKHVLTQGEMPAHTHMARSSTQSPVTRSAENQVWSHATASVYGGSADTMMSSEAVSSSGESQPHNNMQPFTVINYCIATSGVYPSKN